MKTKEKCTCRVHDMFFAATAEGRYDPWDIRRDFSLINRPPLIYLDNAATTHKQSLALNAEQDFNVFHNANAHVGGHRLARKTTEILRDSRRAVADFVGAAPDEIVFTKSATEALNPVARVGQDSGRVTGPDDEIVITELTPRQLHPLADARRADGCGAAPHPRQCPAVRSRPFGPGRSRPDDHVQDEDPRTVPRVERVRHHHLPRPAGGEGTAVGALTVLDACQSIAYMPLHLPSLDVDLAVFSGHKMYGPTGIGAIWGRRALLADLPPYLGGAHMEDAVTPRQTPYAPPPARFEAGTPMVAQALALAAGMPLP
ncbi:aminotransferase class V-fold PLP-dependent enzyme [Actinomadura sp. KC216]|uniref:aminotransferase class V-fold PLP-dependent enzyme n=1 Tax=Actinomadura sp. KC216 TaxID=2530370 RepID=UPI0010464C38|nr:aminotransferase class V-fold PLP-dependent enzyme [Actinomadura sp. KC216]TDB91184.1 aminotransferase class V-fold PLP-dependent enzyme [Actinomadura sp. KC216]